MSRQGNFRLVVIATALVIVGMAFFLPTLGLEITRSSAAETCEGDFDKDCDVDGSDLAMFAADFGRTDCP
jgi:hypothetical protein